MLSFSRFWARDGAVCILSFALILLTLCSQCAGKVCDKFVVDGKTVCGPSLLVPGRGKCGTNAIKEYTELHPNILWPITSEIEFDPREVDPIDLIRKYNPGVTPSDKFVWGLKSPAVGTRDPLELGLALKKVFPSARILLTFCEPSTLPFRWFRHYVTRTLSWRKAETTATPLDLQAFLVRNNFGTTVADVFRAIFPIEGGCEQSEQSRAMLKSLQNTFHIGASWFDFDSTSRPRVCAEWSKHSYDINSNQIRQWLKAGYKLHTDTQNGTLSVVFMEAWENKDRAYMERIGKMLLLSMAEYPWEEEQALFARAADLIEPVYDTEADDLIEPVYDVKSEFGSILKKTGLDVELTTPTLVQAAAEDCVPLRQVLDEDPPWTSCGGTSAAAAAQQLSAQTPSLGSGQPSATPGRLSRTRPHASAAFLGMDASV